MGNRCNELGHSFEYIMTYSLYLEINKTRQAEIIKDKAFYNAKNDWNQIDTEKQELMKKEVEAAISKILYLEPNILEDSSDTVNINLLSDNKGTQGDVRDVVISRKNINWEVGLSLKHNHFAVKHPRLGAQLDFGEKWFGRPCSQTYWNDITPIFEQLEKKKSEGKKWSDLQDKEESVYIPLLNAFKKEILNSAEQDKMMPSRMVEFLLGKYDFYKIIGLDKSSSTELWTFNIHNQLNLSNKNGTPKGDIPIVNLPTKIEYMDYKQGSKNTLELYMDNDWQFSFRLHNASSKIEPSLKFDIQFLQTPKTINVIKQTF